MRYKATQIYLDPADNARLMEEARRRGMSFAALLREIASSHVAERAPAYDAKGWDSIEWTEGDPTDVVSERETYEAEAADVLYEKKMGRSGKR